MEIYNYHGYDDEWIFKSAKGEDVDEKTLFFGLEFAVHGDSPAEDLIADIFHLECAGCFDVYDYFHEIDGFTMVSQLMTLNYLKENIGRIRKVLDALYMAGMEPDDCKMNIHTPLSVYKDRESLRRACGIVHGFKKDMVILCRSRSSIHSCYENIGTVPSTEQLDEIIDHCNDDDYHSLVYLKDAGYGTNQVVEYRMFRETLCADELMAYVELVNNIIKLANSDKPAVTFNDLIYGDYLPQLFRLRTFGRHMEHDKEETIFFGVNDRIGKVIETLKKTARHVQSFEAFDDAITRMLDIISPSDESKSTEKSKVHCSEVQPHECDPFDEPF